MELRIKESPMSLPSISDDSTDNASRSEDCVRLSDSNHSLAPMSLSEEYKFYKKVALTLLQGIDLPNENFIGQQLLCLCEELYNVADPAMKQHAMRFLNSLLPLLQLAEKKPRVSSFLDSWFGRLCYPPYPKTELEQEEWLRVGSIYIAVKGMDDGHALIYLSISEDQTETHWRANGIKRLRERTEYELRARK